MIHPMRPKGGPYEKGLMDFSRMLEKSHVMVEVGCFAGESTVIFARKVGEIYAVDPWKPGYDNTDVASVKMCADVEKEFDEAVKYEPDVVKMKMTSEKASKVFHDLSLDVVYLDACHRYESVRQDLSLWFPKVKTGGIMAGHDFCIPSVRKAVLEFFGKVDGTFVDDSWFIRKVKV